MSAALRSCVGVALIMVVTIWDKLRNNVKVGKNWPTPPSGSSSISSACQSGSLGSSPPFVLVASSSYNRRAFYRRTRFECSRYRFSRAALFLKAVKVSCFSSCRVESDNCRGGSVHSGILVPRLSTSSPVTRATCLIYAAASDL